MAGINDRSKSTVILDGKQAEKELKQLVKRGDELIETMHQAKKAGDDLSYDKALKEFKKVERQQNAVKKGAFDTNKVLNNLDKVSFKDLKRAYRQLNKELDQLERGTEEWTKKNKEVQAVGKEIGKVKQEMRGVTKSTGKATDKTGGLLSSLKGMLPALGPAAIIGAIAAIGAKLFGLTKQINEQRKFLSQLTGETGEGLDRVAAKVGAISQTFQEDFKETGVAANAFAKQMGIEVTDALDLMQKGFAAGANSSGEFLDMLKEYGPQLREAGYTAEEAIAIMTQQVKQGVFSDKGVDTIKEATLRLREMTPATREALDNIGLSSAEIQKGLRDGTLSITEVIGQVSSRLGELPPQSSEVGTAIADIFGGPGEDAGLEYIKTLDSISGNLDQLVEDSGEFAAQQMELVKINEQIEATKNKVFGSSDSWFGEIKIGWKKFVLAFWDGVGRLRSTFNSMKESFLGIWTSFKDLLNAMGLFRKQSDGVASGGKIIATIFKVALLQIRYLANGIKTAIDGFKALIEAGKQTVKFITSGFKKEFVPKLDLTDFKAGLKNFKDITIDTFTNTEEESTEVLEKEIEKRKGVLNNYQEAAKEILKPITVPVKIEFENALAGMDAFLDDMDNKMMEDLNNDLQAIEDYENRKMKLRMQYGLATMEELRQMEFDKIWEAWEEQLISFEDYQMLKQEVIDKYNRIEAEKNEEKRQEEINVIRDHLANVEAAYQVASDWVTFRRDQELDNLEMQKQNELALVGDNEEAKAQIEELYSQKGLQIQKRYADKQFAMRVGEIVASTASGIMGVWAKPGFPAAIPLSILIGASGALQLAKANAERNKVSQLATGRYDVIGESDGRLYSGVPLEGDIKQSRIVRGPTLISEYGDEMVLTAPHVRNLQFNYPALLDAIHATRVPQRAEGSYTTATATAGAQPAAANNAQQMQMEVMYSELKAMRAYLQIIAANSDKPINLPMADFKTAESKYLQITNAAQR